MKGKKIILWVLAALLALILLLGGILLTVTLVQNRNTAMRYQGARADRGTLSCLASYYKYRYLSALNAAGVDAYDDPAFWDMELSEGVSYGDDLIKETDVYLRNVLVCAALYDSAGGGNPSSAVDAAVAEVLTYRADGDVATFNEACARYGFDYDAFRTAATLLYKTSRVKELLYGNEGIKTSSLSAECAEFLAEYAHVDLLFIRTADTFVLNADGKRETDENGNDLLRNLTAEEQYQRRQLIAGIREAIDGYHNDGDVQMSPTMFRTYLEKNGEGDPDYTGSGYYFREGSEFTAFFAEEFSDVVNTAVSMKIGDYAEVETSFGVCFLYRSAPAASANLLYAEEDMFSDFYADLADKLFLARLASLRDGVETGPAYAGFDVLSLPYNHLYIVRF